MLAYVYSEDKKLTALQERPMPTQSNDNAVLRVGAT